MDAPDSETFSRTLVELTDISTSRIASKAYSRPENISDQELQNPLFGFMPRKDQWPSKCGPGFSESMCFRVDKVELDELGFYGVIPHKSNNKVLIAVTGGSVANLLVQHESEEIIKNLDKRIGENIEIVNLALPGAKHPQQLQIIQYLYSIGYKFDIVVDLSGLNEVYLSRHYNMNNGVSYAYPFMMYWYPANYLMSTDELTGISRSSIENEAAFIFFSSVLNSSILKRSAFYRLIAMKLVDIEKSALQVKIANKQNLEKKIDKNYILGATLNKKCKEEKCIDERAYLWKSNIQAMNNFLRDKAYFISLIQPNHYMADSKDLNEHDFVMLRKDFGWEDSDSKSWTIIEDHQLRMFRSNDLLAANLNKPYAFKNTQEKNLIDGCCHLTEIGNKNLAIKVADSINRLVKK
jgi:hypothetical protein